MGAGAAQKGTQLGVGADTSAAVSSPESCSSDSGLAASLTGRCLLLAREKVGISGYLIKIRLGKLAASGPLSVGFYCSDLDLVSV